MTSFALQPNASPHLGKMIHASKALRTCLQKFRIGSFTDSRYYSSRQGSGPSTLNDAMARMSASACERVYRRILSDNYKDRAYRNIDDFVVDVAAIAKKFPAVVASAAGQLLTSPHEQTWCATGKCKSQAACC